MLAVDDLDVRYDRIPAVRGISFHVEAGEIVGLIGPNGAGKTTTLSAITGVLRPEAGSIVFCGRSLIGAAPERIVRQGVALVPEGRRIFSTLSVAENLFIGATVQRKSEAQPEIHRMLERFPVLGRYYRSPAGKLSGGEQQQLAIARALLSRPKLLLLDEPSLGLAPLVIDLLFETLETLRADSVTVLLVEQNARRALELADRTYVMRNGRIALEVSREEAGRLDQVELESTILGFERSRA